LLINITVFSILESNYRSLRIKNNMSVCGRNQTASNPISPISILFD